MENTAREFFNRQLAAWPMAQANFDALKNVEVKELGELGLMPFKVQYNPARRVSSAAKVDAASLKARKCFLCEENRPFEQFSEDLHGYELLINPFPIFPIHFTIPHRSHTPQRIAGRIEDMCMIARDLPGMTVFYNGPKCGASAPDHFHFQAGNTDFLTLPSLIDRFGEVAERGESARLWTLHGLPLAVAIIDGYDISEIAELFNALYEALPADEETMEPMLNILCYVPENAPEDYVRLLVIPRKKHRPSCYGTDAGDCLLISPASVDMGGVFITPREEDFHRVNGDIIRNILEEVCLSPNELETIIEKI